MMDRREFVKMLGIGGLLVGAGAILGAGCPEEEPEEPPMDPEAPMDDPADFAPPPEELP